MVKNFAGYLNVFLATLVFFAHFLSTPAFAVETNAEIPAGKIKSIRLRKVPQGTLVSVDVKSDGDITVLFVESRALAGQFTADLGGQ